MLFASATVAARIEAAEAALTRAVGEVVACGDETLRFDAPGACGLSTGEALPFDKVIGLGFAPVDWEAFERFEAAALARGRRVVVEHATLADYAVAERLTGRGYRLVGFEDVLGRRLDAVAPPLSSSIDVVEVGDEELAAWAEVVAVGFAAPDTDDDGPGALEVFDPRTLVALLLRLRPVPGFRRVWARREGVVAGAASWRAHEGIAQLTGAATLRAHRRRGVQTALLAARLAAAASAGCDLAVITTAPGSTSQENAQRFGFARLYTRAMLAKEGG